jgi:hypothetical protein
MSNNPTSASGASGSGSGRANTDMNAAALLERIPSYTPQLTHPTSALAALLHAASVVRGLAPVEALPQGTEDAYVLRYGAVRVRVGRMGAFLQIDVVQGVSTEMGVGGEEGRKWGRIGGKDGKDGREDERMSADDQDEPPASFSMRAEDVFDPAAFPVTTANATDATSLGFRSVEV